MRLTREQTEGLRGKSPEGVYQGIRELVRRECGVVGGDELNEALRDAIDAYIIDERELRRIEDEG